MPIDLTGKLLAFERFVKVCETTVKIEEAYSKAKTIKSDAGDLFDLCTELLTGESLDSDDGDNDDDDDKDE